MKKTSGITFGSLKVGDSFDWISPNTGYNSFSKTCTKVSARKYVDGDGYGYTVGSLNARVYHVQPAK